MSFSVLVLYDHNGRPLKLQVQINIVSTFIYLLVCPFSLHETPGHTQNGNRPPGVFFESSLISSLFVKITLLFLKLLTFVGDEGADLDTTENEFTLRAEALKTAILKKRPSILRKKFRKKERLKDSIENWKNVEANRNIGSEQGTKKTGEGESKEGKENQEGECVDGGDEQLLRQQLLASLTLRPPPAPSIGPISLISDHSDHVSPPPSPLIVPTHPVLDQPSLPSPNDKPYSQEKTRSIESNVEVNRISEGVTQELREGKESKLCSVLVPSTPIPKIASPLCTTSRKASEDTTSVFQSSAFTALKDSTAISNEKFTANKIRQQVAKNVVLENKEKPVVASKMIPLVPASTAKNTKPIVKKKDVEVRSGTSKVTESTKKNITEPCNTAAISTKENAPKSSSLVSRRNKSGFRTLNVTSVNKEVLAVERIVSQKIGFPTLNVTTVNKGAVPAERIVVSLGPDSSDDDAEETNKSTGVLNNPSF